jgi:hypothetical protein
LRSSKCEQCGDFGGYIYAITCRRVCFICLSEGRSFLPVRDEYATDLLKLRPRSLNNIPQIRMIAGVYSSSEMRFFVERIRLFDLECCLEASGISCGSTKDVQQAVDELDRTSHQMIRPRIRREGRARHYTDFLTRVTKPDVANPIRLMAIVRAPALGSTPDNVEWGSYCIACPPPQEDGRYWRRLFTRSSFRDHLVECGPIKNGKHHKSA